MRLTCNQLIILLALYRGSPVRHVTVGTSDRDFEVLKREGYTDDMRCITSAGNVRAVKALNGLGSEPCT
ncbi:MAG: hypothetical protein M3O74_13810 [Pseudomonadota bacterium]|nr:hypothetical protein [Pseudomonadota bacterium]